MFLVKMQESRDFDVFFGVSWGVFWCLEERKNVESNWAKGKFQKNVCPFYLGHVCGMPRAIYSPGRENRGDGLSMAAGLNLPLVWLILTPLERS